MSFWNSTTTYLEVKTQIHRAYNSPAIQSTIRPEMETLDFDKLMRPKDIEEQDTALVKLIERINHSCERLRPE